MLKRLYKIIHQNRVTISIYVTFLFIAILIFANKVNMHIDEMLSYKLANNDGIVMDFEEGSTYTPLNRSIFRILLQIMCLSSLILRQYGKIRQMMCIRRCII